MTKKLDTTAITNDLANTAFFRQNNKPVQQQESSAPLPESTGMKDEQVTRPATTIPTARPVGEAVYRPDDRPTGKGILVRRGFEWREDQLRALKKLSLKEQLEGKPGSMSQMVRDALDEYLKSRASEE